MHHLQTHRRFTSIITKYTLTSPLLTNLQTYFPSFLSGFTKHTTSLHHQHYFPPQSCSYTHNYNNNTTQLNTTIYQQPSECLVRTFHLLPGLLIHNPASHLASLDDLGGSQAGQHLVGLQVAGKTPSSHLYSLVPLAVLVVEGE